MVTAVTLDCPRTTFPSGTSTQLSVKATFTDTSTADVTNQSNWITTNRVTATVAENGVVAALKPGLTIIKATYKAVTDSCDFHVDDTPPPPSNRAGIVINEFRTRGPNGANDEFIELRNDATASIDISSWRVKATGRSLATTTLVTIPAGIVLDAGCHYLLTRSAPMESYSGSVAGEKTFVTNLNDDGGIVVTRADETVVDAVGMNQEAWYEGIPLASFGKVNADRSYQRVGTDSDNNMADFRMRNPSTPTNRAGSCSPEAP